MENIEIQGLSLQHPVAGSLINPVGILNSGSDLSQSSAQPVDLLLVEYPLIDSLILQPLQQPLVFNSNPTTPGDSSLGTTSRTGSAGLPTGLADQGVGDLATDPLLDHPVSRSDDRLLQIANDLSQLDALFNAAQAFDQIKVLDDLRQVTPTDLKESLNFGLDNPGNQRPRLGQTLGRQGNSASETDIPGFNDPLSGHRNDRPKLSGISAGGFPSRDSLAAQDRGNPVRSWSRDSEDGYITRGHETYADGSRRAERVERQDDGSIYTSSMVWNSDGHVESITFSGYDQTTGTTFIETTRINEDGSKAVHGMEIDAHGEITRTWGTDEIKPEGGAGKTGCEAPEGTTGGSYINPITGQHWGPEIKTSANQVNPGGETPTAAAPRLNFDRRDLVVNPPLETTMADQNFDPGRFEPRIQVNPPRP